jgi:hypothetical protein
MRTLALLLLSACNYETMDSADSGLVDDLALIHPNVCEPSSENCETALTCPVGQFCYVPWNQIRLCGDFSDGGRPICLEPRCSPVFPDGCSVEFGHIVCPCQ